MLQFIDHEVCVKGVAFTNVTGTFYPIDSKYAGYYTYALPYKQIIVDSSVPQATILQGVYLNGEYSAIGQNNLYGILHHKGQVVFTADKSSYTITGNVAVKDYNVYLTTKLEEDLLFNTKHQIRPQTNRPETGLKNEEETYPAIFLKNMGGTNDPLGLGGIDNVKTQIRAVVLSDSAYSLDAVCNILKNTARKNLPIIENSPLNSIGAFTGVIYDYQALSSSSIEQGTIWNVTVTKLTPDTKELKSLNLKVFLALIDFEIHGFGKNVT